MYLFLCKLSVRCSFLTDPNDGVINCSLGDDGVRSYSMKTLVISNVTLHVFIIVATYIAA